MLSLSDTCSDGEAICEWVMTETGNQKLATSADWFVGKPFALLGLALLGLFVRWLLHHLVDRLVQRAEVGMLTGHAGRFPFGQRMNQALARAEAAGASRRVQRAQTMGSLLKSIVTGVVLAVVATMMLSELGANIGPVIASAGIIGVAIGFGAQSLVKDFLSGIFMIFEDQYGVGDVVDVGEASGTVEAVSLRVTRLRDVNGTVWYVRNGEIMRVGNMSQNWARTVLDIPVSFAEDLHRVRGILQDVAHGLWEDEDFKDVIIEEPEVWGVERWDPDGVVVRVTLKTAPLEQWEVAREMRQRIKTRFDYEGVEIPLPQRVVWHREAAGVPQPASAPDTAAPQPKDG